MSLPKGHVYVDLLQVLREQDDILANEAATEIERLQQGRNAVIEECARVGVVSDVTHFTNAYEEGYVEGFLDCEARFRNAIRALKDKP